MLSHLTWWEQIPGFLIAYYIVWHQLIPRWPVATYACMFLMFAYFTVTDVIYGPAWHVPIDLLATIISFIRLQDSWRKRKRRKLLQKLGYKALALRAKLVKAMKDLQQPRRVLRPAPMPV